MAPLAPSASNDSDYFGSEDSEFLEALKNAKLPGDLSQNSQKSDQNEVDDQPPLPPCTQPRYYDEPELPPPSQPRLLSSSNRLEASLKRSHNQLQEDNIYGEAHFGGFGEYARRKRAKLQIQNTGNVEEELSKEPQIFKGIAVFITGWTNPSIQELRALIVRHGGEFHAYLDKKSLVTHIVTSSITPAKVREFKNMKVVRPEWLVESAKRGTLLPWQDYIFRPNQRSETTMGKQGLQQTLPHGFTSQAPASSPAVKNPIHTTDPKNRQEASHVPHYAVDKSNPNAQRVMKNPEWRQAHTSVAPDFIEGYYKNSRLHHLSTWKAELKALLQEAQEKAERGNGFTDEAGKAHAEDGADTGMSMRGAEFVLRSPTKPKDKGKAKATPAGEERVIMHCDFDSFFVSAGLVKRPELRGKPLVVCHSQGAQGGGSSTSEIASASYEARAFGIKNGMSLQQARKLCPDIITIPYEFELYKQFSLKFYTILMGHADDLQAVSVDEALIDVTSTVERLRTKAKAGLDPFSSTPFTDPAKEYADSIRAQVKKATGCEVSIGISHNILLARLATKRAKPAGSFHLLPKDIETVLHPLDVSDLHGFGHSAKQKALDKFGATKLGDLALKSKSVLCDALGKATGETLYNAIRGIDERQLESDKARKSVSCDINYGIRFEANEQVEAFIHKMAAEVSRRLNEIQMLGKSITLKIMKRDPTAPVEPPKFLGHGACDVFNKQMPLAGLNGRATAEPKAIADHAWKMLKAFNFDPKELRGIGIQIQKLESPLGDGHLDLGQGRLQFQKKPAGALTGRATSVAEVEEKLLYDASVATTSKHEAAQPSHQTLDLPSFSQVDKSVLEALPDDIRKELEGEYKRRSESPFPLPQPGGACGIADVPSALPTSRIQFPPPNPKVLPGPSFPFPRKANPTGNVKRITQQLAPRGRGPAWSPNKNIFMKRPSLAAWKVPEHELRKLDIDPEVFAVLPRNVQREQITAARLLKTLGTIPDKATQRVVLKPRKLDPGEVHILPPPKANHIQPPTLKQQGLQKGEKLYFHETDDIQRVIEQWVERYKNWPPSEKDVEFFGKWMIKSLEATDEGMTRAVAVMKWWIILLKRYWAPFELGYDEEDVDPGYLQRGRVGEAWWNAFRTVKDQMDGIAKKRFGGKLSIR
ncbi:deoxycytidyl transferase [Marasmius crinis-equi]|uniref:Deoxycytidyl transferase n=1 Tax=Marasmius crinis-equi TaxID=585013 RepID=A0ABR3FSB3_9AGAR